MQQIPFAIQSYRHESKPIGVQRLVNMYAEQAPVNEKTQVALLSSPGLKSFAVCGLGPIRGMLAWNGGLYVVSGQKLYSVSQDGTATSLGTVPGTAPVKMAANNTQVCIVAEPEGYVYTLGGTVAKITHSAFPGASWVEYLDGYGVFAEPGSGRFFVSSLNDFTTFDALDFATAEAQPDNLVSIISDHRQLFLFGEHSTEIWYNAGAADFPFARIEGAFIERGCKAPATVAKMDNSVFFLGDDGSVYRISEFTPVRISTHAIEQAIASSGDGPDAIGMSYTWQGHKFYSISGDSWNFHFDAATGLWHERETFDRPRWRGQHCAEIWGLVLVGDIYSGSVYSLDTSTYTDAGGVLKRQAVTPHLHGAREYVSYPRFEADVAGGVGLTTGQGSSPLCMLQYSDDEGHTWSNERTAGIGAKGVYDKRLYWTRLGRSRDRAFMLSVSDPVEFTILGAFIP